MRVLVDTSVWSLALRRKTVRSHPKVQVLSDLIASGQSIFLTGIILQEILQGIKDSAQFQKLDSHLSAFAVLEPEITTYKDAARLFSACRSKGVSVSTIDCLIATIAMANDCKLLTDDSDFNHIVAHSSLKLV